MVKILKAHHHGITVRTFQVSLAFYRDLLGFEKIFDWNPQAPYIAELDYYGPMFRENDHVGVIGCMAASQGIPTSCTTDVPTAWALAFVEELPGAALYCEPYTVIDSIESILLANCGISQESMALSGTWKEMPSQFYPGRAGRGISIAMNVMPEPATYVSVRLGDERWDILVVEDQVIDGQLPEFGGAHAYFRPNRITSREMVIDLAFLSSVHHGALGVGHFQAEIEESASEFLPLNVCAS